MKQLFSLLAFLFIFQLTKAQEFLTPLETLTGKVQVTTVDGKTVMENLLVSHLKPEA